MDELKQLCHDMNYKEINQDIGELVAQNDGYCPCAVFRTPDTLCPCKDFREGGKCQCGRFKRGATS